MYITAQAMYITIENFTSQKDEVFQVYTDPDAFAAVTEALEAKGYTFLEAGVQMVPQNYVTLTDEADIKNMEIKPVLNRKNLLFFGKVALALIPVVVDVLHVVVLLQ